MKGTKESGYILVQLSSVQDISWDVFKNTPDYILHDDYAFLSGNIKFPLNGENKNISFLELQKTIPIAWYNRFQRLRSISGEVYRFSIESSNASLVSIQQEAKKDDIDRLLVFSSKETASGYLELLKLFQMNSFLFQRKLHSRSVDQLFFRSGHISKNKIQRMLYQNKAYGVTPYTFQVMPLVLDKDFKNGIDRMVPKVPA